MSNLFFKGAQFSQFPDIIVEMQPFAGGDKLAVFHPDLLGHIFLQQLDGGQVGRKSVPEVPGAEVNKKMQCTVLDPGVNPPQARRILQINGPGVPDGQVGLVGPEAVLLYMRMTS